MRYYIVYKGTIMWPTVRISNDCGCIFTQKVRILILFIINICIDAELSVKLAPDNFSRMT